MAQKNAVYQVDNGSGFDEIHFRTNENMIVNPTQNLADSGYRKLPGGLMIQWGRIRIPGGWFSGINGWSTTLPITFNQIYNISATLSHNNSDGRNIVSDVTIMGDSNTNSTIAFRFAQNGSTEGHTIDINYIAIGR